MSRPDWVPRWRWVFLGTMVFALSSTVQAYRMMALGAKPPAVIPMGRLLVLNTTLWLVPAALAPLVFRLVDWLSRRGVRWIRAFGYHLAAATAFSVLHGAALFAVYVALWWADGRFAQVQWLSSAQSEYLGNLNFSLATYASIAAFGYALEFRHRVHQRALDVAQLETQLAEERLGSVAGELQPEFLYASLDSVSRLVHSNPDGADRIISKLADFLRLVLNRSGAIVGPLQDELECVERYIEIEQVRQGCGLTVTLDIDPETLDADFPPMTLHRLVDILLDYSPDEPRPTHTALTIESSHDQGSLYVRVKCLSDGSPSRAASPTRIEVVRDRLQALYGDRQDVGVTANDHGSSAWVTVPFHGVMAADLVEA